MTFSEIISRVKKHKGPVTVWAPTPHYRIPIQVGKAALIRALNDCARHVGDYDTGWALMTSGRHLVVDTEAAIIARKYPTIPRGSP